MRRRVVITGMGCVTPLGTDRGTIWNRLVAGTPGVRRLSLFDGNSFPVQIAAEVPDWQLGEIEEKPEQWSHTPRQTQFTVAAAFKAVREAGVDRIIRNPRRFGVYLGCGEPFEDFTEFTRSICESSKGGVFDSEAFQTHALRLFNPEAEREFEPDMAARHLAGLFNAQGPHANCIAACVSSAQAIGRAVSLIRRGDADIMLCGGAHSTIHPFGLTGFQRLSALSTRNEDPEHAVRPFERDRDGFVIGEGAAIFVIEALEHARARGAEIQAEITGYGSAQDAYRVTDSHPEGRGTAAAMQSALKDAGLNTDDIDYINAHGTGTIMNDKVETLGLKRAFGADAYRIPVSSSKSMMGHATTGCAALELAVCVMTLQHGIITPTINYDHADPECDLDYVPNTARDKQCRHVLSNSIGFGGQNAALVVSRFEDRVATTVPARKAA